jgi:tetratricopeptide (TPR) repeat protein
MDSEKLKNVTELLKAENANDAQALFQEIIPTETVEYWLIKGKLEQKFQHWSEAINAFAKVLELDPKNSEAQNQLHLVQNILNFWNPEMFNP